ncbi:MAG: WG repeat-containing protein [Candidatus Cloacimonetes bacterium]|nr:WG repeat-containing protein [Candidatus Cloacimonadota bacterium]
MSDFEFIYFDFNFIGRFISEGFLHVCRYQTNGPSLWGFADTAGNEIISCKYEDVHNFSDGMAAIKPSDGSEKWGFIDILGNQIIPSKYDVVYNFVGGIAVVGIGSLRVTDDASGLWLSGKWGCIDKEGNEVITPGKYKLIGKYRYEPRSSSPFAKIHENEVDNYIGSPFERKFCEDISVVVDNETDKCGYIDKHGNEVIPCKYDAAHNFSKGVAWVNIHGKWLFIDIKGNEIPQDNNRDSHNPSQNLKAVEQDGKWGFADETGNIVIPCIYDKIGDRSEGMTAVRIGDYETGKWGFVDENGFEIVVCRYAEVKGFHEGFAAVRLEVPRTMRPSNHFAMWGYIDKRGNEIIPCVYRELGNFYKGFAYFEEHNTETWFLSGKKGFIKYCPNSTKQIL